MEIIKRRKAAARRAALQVVMSEPLPGDQFWPMRLPYAEARPVARAYCHAASAAFAALRFRSVVREVTGFMAQERERMYRSLGA